VHDFAVSGRLPVPDAATRRRVIKHAEEKVLTFHVARQKHKSEETANVCHFRQMHGSHDRVHEYGPQIAQYTTEKRKLVASNALGKARRRDQSENTPDWHAPRVVGGTARPAELAELRVRHTAQQ
jgi:hypothetical protein